MALYQEIENGYSELGTGWHSSRTRAMRRRRRKDSDAMLQSLPERAKFSNDPPRDERPLWPVVIHSLSRNARRYPLTI